MRLAQVGDDGLGWLGMVGLRKVRHGRLRCVTTSVVRGSFFDRFQRRSCPFTVLCLCVNAKNIREWSALGGNREDQVHAFLDRDRDRG